MSSPLRRNTASLRSPSGALALDASVDNWHLSDAGYAELKRRIIETARNVGFPLR